MPENQPVVPAQPNKERYSITELYLCPVYDRASYEAETGEQAPPFNPKLPVKRWFLRPAAASALAPEIEFWGYEDGAIKKLLVPSAVAEQVNLPGSYRYPVYAPSDKTVAYALEFGRKTDLSAASLVDKAHVEGVVAEMKRDLPGVDIGSVELADPWPARIVYGSETRRRMAIVINGLQAAAELVLVNRFANGIGRPGAWSLAPSGEPVFTPAPEPAANPNVPETPVPIRPLLPNEKFELSPFSGPMIVRTDWGEPAAPAGGESELIEQIAKDVAAIKRWLGVEETV